MSTRRSILVVNAGSSSMKINYYDGPDSQEKMTVICNLIGMEGATVVINEPGSEPLSLEVSPDSTYKDICKIAFGHIANRYSESIVAIGHRLVHGGNKFAEPVVLSDDTLNELDGLVPFDRLHMVSSINVIRIADEYFPEAWHVACFDTAFYESMPKIAQMLPLPAKFADMGFRRYGFHGLSYEYLAYEFRKLCGEEAANARVIYAQLGSGVSLTATSNGVAIDTTMSMTSNSGVPMSTRSGSIDSGIFELLHTLGGVEYGDIDALLSKESGLLGVSGRSADMYNLLQHEDSDQRSRDAVDLFCYEVKKSIGSLTAVLGGLDSLVISGGMGENSDVIRQRILGGLGYLGVDLDDNRNSSGARYIASDSSRVGVHIIHTNEASVIARHTYTALEKYKKNIGE